MLLFLLNYLVPAVITQISNPTTELVILLGISTKQKKKRNWKTSSICSKK